MSLMKDAWYEVLDHAVNSLNAIHDDDHVVAFEEISHRHREEMITRAQDMIRELKKRAP